MVARHSCLTKGSQILSSWEENTHMVAIFSYSTLTCYKWRIHGIFILETTLLVGYECIKCSACEGLHLWSNWRVLFLTMLFAVIKYTYLLPTYPNFIQDIKDRCLLLTSSMSFVDLPFQEHWMIEKHHMDQNPCIYSLCPK
jgi:hypothetical protein